jgi:hypothetical protein
MKSDLIILDLCGGTGAWSRPYEEAGYTVFIIDPVANGADVRLLEYAHRSVHGILCAPPCTDLAGSGAQYWEEKGDEALLQALSVVDACLRCVMLNDPVWWALENPVGRLTKYLGKPKMYFHPYNYGDPWFKQTGLWGEFTEPIRNPVEPTEGSRALSMGPSPVRQKLRSITPDGFAQAFFESNP